MLTDNMCRKGEDEIEECCTNQFPQNTGIIYTWRGKPVTDQRCELGLEKEQVSLVVNILLEDKTFRCICILKRLSAQTPTLLHDNNQRDTEQLVTAKLMM